MTAPLSNTSQDLYEVEAEDGEDEHGATTKVGPMSRAIVEQMMHEAERRAGEAPASMSKPIVESKRQPAPKASDEAQKITLAPPPLVLSGDLPVLSDDEDDDAYNMEPTLLNPRSPDAAAAAHAVAEANTSGAARNMIDSLVEELASNYLEDVADASPDAAKSKAQSDGQSDGQSSALSSSRPPAVQSDPHAPRPAAFPEWLGVTFRPDERDRSNSLLIAFSLGAGAFILTLVILWALFL